MSLTALLKQPDTLLRTTRVTAALEIEGETVVAAVTGRIIRVHSLALASTAGAANAGTFDATSGTIYRWRLVNTAPLILPFSPIGWFETPVSELLEVASEVSGGTQYTITMSYSLVEPPS